MDSWDLINQQFPENSAFPDTIGGLSGPVQTFQPAPPANEDYHLVDTDGPSPTITTFEESEVNSNGQPTWEMNQSHIQQGPIDLNRKAVPVAQQHPLKSRPTQQWELDLNATQWGQAAHELVQVWNDSRLEWWLGTEDSRNCPNVFGNDDITCMKFRLFEGHMSILHDGTTFHFRNSELTFIHRPAGELEKLNDYLSARLTFIDPHGHEYDRRLPVTTAHRDRIMTMLKRASLSRSATNWQRR